ncbi:MAG TPA: GGDEF domain-containing protein [Lachnospiraceae bacterium]|nr:GGDEF domain-containing protein [Lachnospiraceae bacterium]
MNFNSNCNIVEHENNRMISLNNKIFRVHSVIMCIYFLSLLFTVFLNRNYVILLICIPCFILYCIGFYVSYFVKPSKLLWIHYAVTMLFMICFVVVFGWECGVQCFAFVMIAIKLATWWGNIKIRALDTMILFLVCMLLYGYTRMYDPIYDITPATTIIFQVINYFVTFSALFSCLGILIKDMKETQEHLSSLEEKLEHFASEDSLTGLFNRRTIIQYIEQLTEQRKSEGKSNICAAIGDIDFFSKINDRYGHDCGDIMIKQLAYQLSLSMKDKGKIARWGGEQFLFIFDNATGEDAYYYLTKMQQHIRSVDFAWNDENINLTMTYGLMEYNPDKSIDYCIVEADKKMFMGKQSGRNTIIY